MCCHDSKTFLTFVSGNAGSGSTRQSCSISSQHSKTFTSSAGFKDTACSSSGGKTYIVATLFKPALHTPSVQPLVLDRL